MIARALFAAGRRSLARAPVAASSAMRMMCSVAEPARHPALHSYSGDLQFLQHGDPISCYRVMNEQGQIVAEDQDPELDQDTVTKMYVSMVRLNVMDFILYEAQRQGRISFYMTNYGEEASHIGCAAALTLDDIIFGQYREAGVLLWRGFEYPDFINQCVANKYDPGKGRQMPVHYGSSKLNFQTISSPLATQIPQAVGAGYSLKLNKKPAVSVAFFGDGSASEGDFHAALNMAATTESPTLFFCRNNGYAISTPVAEQYRGDGIASRGAGYGMKTIRVDGNDVFAVYNVVKQARKMAVEQPQPVLIEALTYRGGHHSTSDDSTRYRQASELKSWNETNNPIRRLRLFLEAKGWWSEDQDNELRTSSRKEVLQVLSKGEGEKKPAISEMFNDVYAEVPYNLRRQQQQLNEHLANYGQHYNTTPYEE